MCESLATLSAVERVNARASTGKSSIGKGLCKHSGNKRFFYFCYFLLLLLLLLLLPDARVDARVYQGFLFLFRFRFFNSILISRRRQFVALYLSVSVCQIRKVSIFFFSSAHWFNSDKGVSGRRQRVWALGICLVKNLSELRMEAMPKPTAACWLMPYAWCLLLTLIC